MLAISRTTINSFAFFLLFYFIFHLLANNKKLLICSLARSLARLVVFAYTFICFHPYTFTHIRLPRTTFVLCQEHIRIRQLHSENEPLHDIQFMRNLINVFFSCQNLTNASVCAHRTRSYLPTKVIWMPFFPPSMYRSKLCGKMKRKSTIKK